MKLLFTSPHPRTKHPISNSKYVNAASDKNVKYYLKKSALFDWYEKRFSLDLPLCSQTVYYLALINTLISLLNIINLYSTGGIVQLTDYDFYCKSSH